MLSKTEAQISNALPFYHLDDNDFRLTLFQFKNSQINYDPDRLSSLKFNPFMSELNDNFSLSKDIDPDFNFYSQAINCKYYSEGNFNKLLAKNVNNNAKLSLLHLNICSISRKLDNLTNFLGNLALDFSIIGLTETWLDNSNHLSYIEG